MSANSNVYIYRIDRQNRILSVSENWAAFARANNWSGPCAPEEVVGRPLLDFVAGAEMRHLYEQVFEKVRSGRIIGPFPFRCDSPALRRFMSIRLVPLGEGEIELISTILGCEPREPVQFPEGTGSRKIMKICSICKKIEIADNEWVEVEEGLARLGQLEKETPQLSHGLCLPCFHSVINQLR